MNSSDDDDSFDGADGDAFGLVELDDDIPGPSSASPSSGSNHNSPSQLQTRKRKRSGDVGIACGNIVRDVLDPHDVAEIMAEEVNSVSDILGIGSDCARILLNHLSWDREKLLEKFFGLSESKQTEMLEEAGVPLQDTSLTENNRDQAICKICFDDTVSPVDLVGSDMCPHRFCLGCWKDYIKANIANSTLTTGVLRCAATNCSVTVSSDLVSSVLDQEDDLFTQYTRLITDGFVISSRFLHWCPGLNCSNVVRVRFPAMVTVECSCGCRFCFACGDLEHEPASCQMLVSFETEGERIRRRREQFMPYFRVDRESDDCNLDTAKNCPSCRCLIDKLTGCNHITCPKCRTHFCWMCLNVFRGNDYSCRCGRFSEATPNQVLSRTLDGRAARKIQFVTERQRRLRHYRYHYDAQNHSLAHEKRVTSRMSRFTAFYVEETNGSDAELRFLSEAISILYRSRKIILNSFVFAFYLCASNAKKMFEDNQEFLQEATERLSATIESILGLSTNKGGIERYDKGVKDVKSCQTHVLVVDQMQFCAQRCAKLVRQYQEGLEVGEFDFIKPLDEVLRDIDETPAAVPTPMELAGMQDLHRQALFLRGGARDAWGEAADRWNPDNQNREFE